MLKALVWSSSSPMSSSSRVLMMASNSAKWTSRGARASNTSLVAWRIVARVHTSSRKFAEVSALETAKLDESAKAVSTSAVATNALAATSLTMNERMKLYSQLSKIRLSSLVVMTTGAGFLMAGGPISWSSLAAVTVGTSLAAASANTFNQAYEIEMDSKMSRTCKRPLPSGKISRNHALGFGAASAVASTAILGLGCNPVVASLGLFNIGLYSMVYTPLKTRSEANTWVGSVVGAIPPVMGWAAATGSMMAPEAALQAAMLFCWQMPHFFALGWRSRGDYMRGGYKMVSCADPTGSRTAKLIMRYSLYMAAIPVVASVCDATSYMYAVEGAAVNAYAVYLANKFVQNPTNAAAQRVFLCSLWYLPLMLGLMVFHSQQWLPEEEKQAKRQQKQVWREAFFGEIPDDDFHAVETVHPDADSWSQKIGNRIVALRHQLKQVCVHELLWGVKTEAPSGGGGVGVGVDRHMDQTSLLCPVHLGKSTVETTAIVAAASSHHHHHHQHPQDKSV